MPPPTTITFFFAPAMCPSLGAQGTIAGDIVFRSRGMGAADFAGNDRFHLIRRLGEGGMGVVYEAEDRHRGHRVALKTFKAANSESLYWFKREFRALADLSHPNLIDLYDLVSDGGVTFFTMELVIGEDFCSYCQPRVPVRAAQATPSFAIADTVPVGSTSSMASPMAASLPLGPDGPIFSSTERARVIAGRGCDEMRLRASLVGLIRGLEALHRAGKLHRDVKPSNVVVTEKERVVLLDFGLARDIATADGAHDGWIVGTPAYMSPEQAAGDANLGPASDWYSVGVMIYEALTGRLPFGGPLQSVLEDKQRRVPPPPRALAPHVSPDLDELCVALLSIDPARRPSPATLLERLGGGGVPTKTKTTAVHGSSESVRPPFTGREADLDRMMGAFGRVERGEASAVLVRGVSGMGKTELVREFIRRARDTHGQVLVLEGRCYEREDIPYKAIDSLVDHLSAHWRGLPRAEMGALLPREAGYLAKLFPVLGRVPAVAEAPQRLDATDPQEARTRAFGAFRELLQRLCARGPVVLFLDDLQWVDGDTVTLLTDVLRPPDPPELMLVLAARSADAAARHAPVLDLGAHMGLALETIEIGPLGREDSARLASHFLGHEHAPLVERVAVEAAGSPLFVAELARYLTSTGDVSRREVSLDEVLGLRVAALSTGARDVLEAVVVAGEPISREVLARVVDADPATLQREARALSVASLLRATGGRNTDRLAPYHDRIREVVLRDIDAARKRACHRNLAAAMQRDGSNEQLARHWHGAGEDLRAASHARKAGDEAVAKLDFDRAAELYRFALGLGGGGGEKRALRTQLADALANAGRPADAASEYSAAAADAPGPEQIVLRRRTAEQLLRGGYLDEGLDAVRVALGQVGIRLAATAGRAMLSLLWHRLWMRIRGARWRRRDADSVPNRALTRADVCWTVSLVLSMVDHIRGAEIQSRHLLLALRMGEPVRVGRALAMEAAYLGTQGEPRRGRMFARWALQIADETQDPYVRALHHGSMSALVGYSESRWRASQAEIERSAELFRAHHQAAGWETDTLQFFACENLRLLGELKELCQRVPKYVREAERRGDRYAEVNLRTRFSTVFLAADDADGAERDLRAAVDSWIPASRAFLVQHYYALHSWCEIHLYRGDPDAATALVRDQLRPLQRSFLLTLPAPRSEFQFVCGRIALARKDTRSARRLARKLGRTNVPLSRWFCLLLNAGIARQEGDLARATAHLRDVIDQLEVSETRLLQAAARRRLGELTGTPALIDQADSWMRTQGIHAPARMTDMILPR
jgi:serine/threonine protein kinase